MIEYIDRMRRWSMYFENKLHTVKMLIESGDGSDPSINFISEVENLITYSEDLCLTAKALREDVRQKSGWNE